MSGEKVDGIGDVDTAFSGTVDISRALASTNDGFEVASASRLARALFTEDSINKVNCSAYYSTQLHHVQLLFHSYLSCNVMF